MNPLTAPVGTKMWSIDEQCILVHGEQYSVEKIMKQNSVLNMI